MTRPSKGKFFVFEGPDGVGKTSISRAVFDALQTERADFLYLSFPGQEPGTLGKLVYDLHHEPEKFGIQRIDPSSMQILHVAAHVETIKGAIAPAIRSGKNVILDRFWWSVFVYGSESGVGGPVLRRMIALENRFWKDLLPDAVFLIGRDAPIDRDLALKDWTRLVSQYERLAESERLKHPVFKIKNDSSLGDAIEIVKETVLHELDDAADFRSRSGGDADPVQRSIEFDTPPQDPAPLVSTHISPLKPTIVYDTYWRFAVKRQDIFFDRLSGKPAPWTDDPILLSYKFTNAYRASDRASQFLIRNVIYNPVYSADPKDVFFRIMLFKFFNKIETWNSIAKELKVDAVGNFDFRRCDDLLTAAMNAGNRIYSAAYIMPSGGRSFIAASKHSMHLKLLEKMVSDKLHTRIASSEKMSEAFDILRSYPTIGDFLAYQFITDINYSEITDFNEMDFVVPGPGARNGIRKCFTDLGGLSEAELIRYIAERQKDEFARLGLEFKDLWGRPLQLIDCQNLFCEVDKYSRVKHPTILGLSQRTRIKQSYRTNSEQIDYWYPPKWGINEKMLLKKRGKRDGI